VAALAGGTWHGILPDVLPSLRCALWSTTYVAIGLADLLLLAGATRASLGPATGGAVLALLAARFLAYAGLVVSLRQFRVVAAEFGVTLVLLLAFALDLARRREPAAVHVLAGAGLSLAGGLVLALDLRPHPRFNDNDLFHVIQTGGVLFLFQAALLLRGHGEASPSIGKAAVLPTREPAALPVRSE
jgi:hypothetical protein